MKRCTSPSHFALSAEEELKYGADYTLDLPSRERVDQLLRHVAAFYYKPKELHPNGINVWVDNEYDQSVYPTLDLLLSPLRRPSARESWSNREVAIFESALCKIGKRFGDISRMLRGSKSTNQCVEFYYSFWKKHQHYKIWKGQQQQQRAAGSETAGAEAATGRASSGGGAQQSQQQSRAARGATSDAATARSAAASAAGTTVPAAVGAAAAASSSPAGSPIPASLISSRLDNSHPRIRMVDASTGAEHFFILPIINDEVALRVLQRNIEADEKETEKIMRRQQQQQQQQQQEETMMKDEQQETEPAATTPTTERTKRTAAPRPPRPTSSARSPSPSASSAAAASAPSSGFRCILPALGDSSRTCNKFFTSTNSLGSHLFMTHKLTKATAGGIEKGYYIQCVK